MKDFEFIKNVIENNPSMVKHISKELKAFWVVTEHKYIWQFEEDEFNELLDLHKDEIKTRPDPTKRVEDWECFDVMGLKCEEVRKMLLETRADIPARRQRFTNRRAAEELVKCVKGATMADFKLILSEIKLNHNYTELREKAKLLNLI